MASADVLSYPYWQKLYNRNGFLIGRSKLLGKSAVFMWFDEQVWDINHTFWQWFSDAKELLGFMQFVFFPRHISYLIKEKEPDKLPKLGQLLALVETRKDADCADDNFADIAAFVKFIDMLNSLHNSPPAVIMRKLKLIYRNFNKMNVDPSHSYGLTIAAFSDIAELGKEIIRRAKINHDYSTKWERDWVASCDNALSNRRAMSKVIDAIKLIS